MTALLRSSSDLEHFFPSEIRDQLIAGRDPQTEEVDDPQFIPARRLGGEEKFGGTMTYVVIRAGLFYNGLIFLNDGGRLSVTQGTY
ncbi:hypothetical protein BDU57DRAFT_519068 [Ampelomyces quisqualis]|uniref:Uncharacterized protein n=1 Tax=Ampelomyces quisqualis TaxID=50730 RepID=A0A6A5QF63_AMPQU|nr:hypothetical protein BDU57DRAFT_519068 [Ampelomyces quisqualis]